MQKFLRSGSQCKEEAEEQGFLDEGFRKGTEIEGDQNLLKVDTECEQSKTRTRKEGVLAFFNRSKLQGDLKYEVINYKLEMSNSNHGFGRVLNPLASELNENLKLVQPHYKKNQKYDFFELLQHEISHLREKFELNDKSYQIEDLMRLTVNSKNILKLRSLQENKEYDKKMEDSVYYDLECDRMTLEKNIGFSSFSEVYRKMIHIINDKLNSFLKNSFGKEYDLSKTCFIKKVQVAGDNDDLIKNTWKSIIDVLGDKQEYLPDIWELAMSESICYH